MFLDSFFHDCPCWGAFLEDCFQILSLPWNWTVSNRILCRQQSWTLEARFPLGGPQTTGPSEILLPPRRYPAGDIWQSLEVWLSPRGGSAIGHQQGKHPTMHKKAPTTKTYPVWMLPVPRNSGLDECPGIMLKTQIPEFHPRDFDLRSNRCKDPNVNNIRGCPEAGNL